MSLGKRAQKSEHSGAKNGGGHWGTRAEAKRISKKARRFNDKLESDWKDEAKSKAPLRSRPVK